MPIIRDNTVTLGYPNRVDQATLSGGSWIASLPRNNLQNRIFAKRARTVDTSPVNTQFVVDLAQQKNIGCVAIAAHNLSQEAAWRIRFYFDNTQTLLLYDSGVITVWPSGYDQDDVEWEDNDFWFGGDYPDSTSELTPISIHFSDQTYLTGTVLVEIFDEANVNEYIEIGRAFVSEVFQPTINMNYGVGFGYKNETTSEIALDGTEFFDRKRQKRTVDFDLENLTVNEAFKNLYTMYRTQNIDKEILFAYQARQTDSLDAEQFYFRSFISRIQQNNPIVQPYQDRYTNTLNLVEII